MKKVLAIILIFCALCFSGCESSDQGFAFEQNDEYTKITLDNFEGKKKIEIVNDSVIGRLLTYSTNITDGGVKASFREGWLFGPYDLFDVSADTNSEGASHYIDSSTTKIIITIEAEQGTSGEILLALS